MADYARYYGGAPAPELSWSLFLALTERCSRYEARSKLTFLDAIALALSAAFSTGGKADRERDRIFRSAYPVKRRSPKIIQNKFADQESPEDG